MKKIITCDNTNNTNNTVDGSFSVADKSPNNPFKLKDESIEINCPVKVDGEVLEIDLSRLDEDEKKQFHSLLKKIQKSKVWKPEIGEQYWYIDPFDGVCAKNWDEYDKYKTMHSTNNYYKSREEAIIALEKLRVETEIKRYIEEYDPEKITWENNSNKCYINYSHAANKIQRCSNMARQTQGVLYFSGKLDWVSMVSTIGEDRIKKYIFGVE